MARTEAVIVVKPLDPTAAAEQTGLSIDQLQAHFRRPERTLSHTLRPDEVDTLATSIESFGALGIGPEALSVIVGYEDKSRTRIPKPQVIEPENWRSQVAEAVSARQRYAEAPDAVHEDTSISETHANPTIDGPLPHLPTVEAPTKSPVGWGSLKRRRQLADSIRTSVENDLVHPQRIQTIEHGRHGKMYFVVPFGDTASELALNGLGSDLLGNTGRISARMRHTWRQGKTASDMRKAFGRLEVGILNDDHYMPFVEQAMSAIQASTTLKEVESLGEIGAAVNTVASIAIPVLKLFTRDSGRAKITSLIANPLLGGLTDVITTAAGFVGPFPFWLSSSRLENGFDMGDQIADVGQFVGYELLLQNPHVKDARKDRIAKAFMAEYTKGEGPDGPRPSPAPEEMGHEEPGLLDKGLTVVDRVTRYADVPGLGEAAHVAHLAKGAVHSLHHEERSMRERTNDILAIADSKIADAEAVIAAHPRRHVHLNYEYHEAVGALVRWQYMKEVASLLQRVAALAEPRISK